MVTFFETLGGTYRQEGDYLLPNIEIPEILQLGFWGQWRHKYLLEHQHALYTAYSRICKEIIVSSLAVFRKLAYNFSIISQIGV